MNNHENFYLFKVVRLIIIIIAIIFIVGCCMIALKYKKREILYMRVIEWTYVAFRSHFLNVSIWSPTVYENNVPKGIKQCVNPAWYIRISIIRIRLKTKKIVNLFHSDLHTGTHCLFRLDELFCYSVTSSINYFFLLCI